MGRSTGECSGRAVTENKMSLRTAVEADIIEPGVKVGALKTAFEIPPQGARQSRQDVGLPIRWHWLNEQSTRTNIAEAHAFAMHVTMHG